MDHLDEERDDDDDDEAGCRRSFFLSTDGPQAILGKLKVTDLPRSGCPGRLLFGGVSAPF